MNFVSLFAGIGGEHAALRNALRYVPRLNQCDKSFYAFDFAPHAERSFRVNFPDVDFRLRDLSATNAIGEGLADVDFLWSSAPCTEFSSAKEGRKKNEAISNLNDLVFERWVKPTRPRVAVFENVVQMRNWGPLDENGVAIRDRRGENYRRFLNKLRSLGYTVSEVILDGADYGDAATRRRLFVVAVLGGLSFTSPPIPSEVKHKYIFDCVDLTLPARPIKSVWEVFKMRLEKARALGVSEGVFPSNGFSGGMWGRRFDQKFQTFTTNAQFIVTKNLSEVRKLTAPEMGKALGFPDNFIYPNPPSVNVLGVGNSVSVTAVTNLLTMVLGEVFK